MSMRRSNKRSSRGGSESERTSEPRFLVLGRVRRPHGVRGELLLKLMTDYPERIGGLDRVYLAQDVEGNSADAYPVQRARRHRGDLILDLETVNDRDHADILRDKWVLIAMEDAIPLEDGEFYLFQLVGLTVETTDGEVLGTIKDVLETGANDVYVVEGGSYGEVLVPAAPHVVRSIDLDAQRVTVELPEGLL